jgi:uncharacterized protein
MSYKIIDSLHQEIGKTIASERFLNTMDGFWFALKPNVIINSFDFVTVDTLFNSKSIGIIQELQAVTAAEHDYYNYYLSDNHTISSTKELLKKKGKEKEDEEEKSEQLSKRQLNSLILVKVAIMANIGVKAEGYEVSKSVNFPVGVGKTVRFATEEEIIFALGIPQMENPIPAGIIETTNGLEVPITLDISYLAGADTAHVNASGISGNRKSSYILFLLQSSY